MVQYISDKERKIMLYDFFGTPDCSPIQSSRRFWFNLYQLKFLVPKLLLQNSNVLSQMESKTLSRL